MPFIYLFTFPNGKQYVGQTYQLKCSIRWNQHRKTSKNPNDKGYDALLYRAIRRHGWENITKEVICECFLVDLNDLETKYIKEYDTLAPNGYNCTTGGSQNMVMSEDSKSKMKSSAIKRFTKTEEIKKISIAAIKRFQDSDEKKKHSIRMRNRDSTALRKNADTKNLPKYVRVASKRKNGTKQYGVVDHPLCKRKTFIVSDDYENCEEMSLKLSIQYVHILNAKMEINALLQRLESIMEIMKKQYDELTEIMNAVQRLNGSWGGSPIEFLS